MSLTRPMTSIQNDLYQLFNELDRDFMTPMGGGRTGEETGSGLSRIWAPPMDISEDEKNIEVCVSVPGMKRDDINVEVENNRLVISGETRQEKDAEPRKNYHRREIVQGSFCRQITLPVAVQGDKADASFEDGVLRITVPKSEQTRRHRVQIGNGKQQGKQPEKQ